jgi:hypothetical protein
MINGSENLSPSAKVFYRLLKENCPELLAVAEVMSTSEKTPLIQEPGSIIIKIPAPQGFIANELYIESRRTDILVAIGQATHHHVDWYKEEDREKSMRSAIQYVKDILSEKVIVVVEKSLFSKNGFVHEIRIDELKKKKRYLAIYSWNGTYNIST